MHDHYWKNSKGMPTYTDWVCWVEVEDMWVIWVL